MKKVPRDSLYIIGDVHGCFKSLMALIDTLPFKEDSHLVFVGDLVDRGKYSAQVVEFVKNGGYPCVLGNHEAVMVQAHRYEEAEGIVDTYSTKRLWKLNGGRNTISSYFRPNAGKMSEHLAWMKNLPRYLEFDINDENGKTLFVTHGFGLPFWRARAKKETAIKLRNNRLVKRVDTLKVREHYAYEEGFMDYPVFNVFGHDVVDNVTITESYAAIDTGCVYGRLPKSEITYLSALEWPSKRIYSVPYQG